MVSLSHIRKHPELKHCLEQANLEILMSEAEIAAVELRKCLEYIVKMYYDKYCDGPKNADLNNMIESLRTGIKTRKIQFKVLHYNDIDLFHQIRLMGNEGAHGNQSSLRKVEERYYDLEEFLPKFFEEFN